MTPETQHNASAPAPKTGRFAPSPSGRMHLGNITTALVSWLSARASAGRWILRIEDLDPQRSKPEFARLIEDDLHWLGLDWDEGGLADSGPAGPYSQSRRGEIYSRYLSRLRDTGLTYPCFCTRADIMASRAPHQSDGRIVYRGTCRPEGFPAKKSPYPEGIRAAERLYVPDRDIDFSDMVFGDRSVNLSSHCGDFVLRRADGAWAYQLAVVVDDALMGVTEVVRGCDLLLSTAQQLYIYRLLGLEAPAFAHLPLVSNESGQRLSKRDRSMSMEALRATFTPAQIIGRIARMIGLDAPEECLPEQLIPLFDWSCIKPLPAVTAPSFL